jgi:hypothetical protein
MFGSRIVALTFIPRLLEIGGSISQKAIYLHLMWPKDNPYKTYLYVGQRTRMETRHKNHCDPGYRQKHSSLHYFVWDLYQGDEKRQMQDAWIFLCNIHEDVEVDPLLLNLLEMWCALTLQTLTRNALERYLPKGKLAPCAGRHLNVALPLHQSARGERVNDIFHGDLYHSKDPEVQRYYQSLRRRFYDLKESPNQVHRDYYAKTVHESHQKRVLTMRNNSTQQILNGKAVRVRINRSTQIFVLSHFAFNIQRSLIRLKGTKMKDSQIESSESTMIYAQVFLEDVTHPYYYAQNSLSNDPARRLGVLINGRDENGTAFRHWLRTLGEQAIWKMNTFVDFLEEVDIWKPEMRSRRWVPKHSILGQAPYSIDRGEVLPANRREKTLLLSMKIVLDWANDL